MFFHEGRFRRPQGTSGQNGNGSSGEHDGSGSAGSGSGVTPSKVSKVVRRAIEYAQKNSSLTWFDYLWCRALKNFKGESYFSLENADMAYLLKLNEYLDVEEFINEVSERDHEAKVKADAAANRRSGGRRG